MQYTANELLGRQVRDRVGRAVGRVTGLYRYPIQYESPWGVAEVTQGHLFPTVRLVDLHDAVFAANVLTVAYPAAAIDTAPSLTALISDTLSDRNAREVRDHYRTADN
jgi:hypothetical protein